MHGPLGQGLSALLLGRSSTSRKRVFVLPGIIDDDFTGVISIMVWTLFPPVHIPKGSKIGQLVPFYSAVPKVQHKERGEGGFGSTGPPELYLALEIHKKKPTQQVTLSHPDGGKRCLSMLIDTGADVTVVSLEQWPSNWELDNPSLPIMGVGGVQATKVSAKPIQVMLEDGSHCTIRPYVMPLPICLVGRDVLSQLGAIITTGIKNF